MASHNTFARLARDSRLVSEAQTLFFSNRGLTRETVKAWPETSREALNRQWCVSSEKANLDIALACVNDLPCADAGFISYRYDNAPFGFVMIGASHDSEALEQAALSITGKPDKAKLQVWNGEQYVNQY